MSVTFYATNHFWHHYLKKLIDENKEMFLEDFKNKIVNA